ncbi:MAG TPA: hypothetical protein VFW78_01945 [Bacteroidia bacterium]|nr:hypothetical protein [Bacteroidia bacterium]
MKSKSIHNDNMFPVFRFDFENRLTFANIAATPLMSHWKCRINERIPGEVMAQYPELFHSVVSHRPQDVQVNFNDFVISFSIVPFPEAGYIGMYAYNMSVVNETSQPATQPELVKVKAKK